jgi:Xaa-Pro aminopeptidase
MRRGLMGWNSEELPLTTLKTRLVRLRSTMKAAGLDGLVVYTNNVRPSAMTYITGFTPYWSDALLLVPKNGAPVFATALSKRVSEWIRTTDPLSEIVNTPKPGTLIGERLAKDATVKKVGVLELDALPAGLSDDLAAAAPTVEWVDASALFGELRRSVDDVERKLILHADAIAAASLGEADSGEPRDAGTLAGLIEKRARLAGAEEAYIAVAPDIATDRRFNRLSKPVPLADRFAVRASVAYKGAWVRRTRTFATDAPSANADAWFDELTRALQAGKTLASQVIGRVEWVFDATLQSWMAESCTGSYPLSVIASSRAPSDFIPVEGQFLVLTVELSLNGTPWIGAAPMFVGRSLT